VLLEGRLDGNLADAGHSGGESMNSKPISRYPVPELQELPKDIRDRQSSPVVRQSGLAFDRTVS